jgi:quercetin dioxygenase-like cupin family protein
MLTTAKLDQSKAKQDTSRSFDGVVQTTMLIGADQSKELELLAVYFSAGARTHPHIHERDQVLHFVQGKGIVATEKEKRICSAGDIVAVPGGVWHWHGATRDQAACHISIRPPGSTNWDVESKNWADY